MMVSLTLILINSLLTLMSFARIINLSAPATVHAGEIINAVFTVENYIQAWTEFGIIWGLKPKDWISKESDLGSMISYDDIYSNNQSQSGNITFSVLIPEGQASREYILTAAIPYLTGAAASANITYFQQDITVVG